MIVSYDVTALFSSMPSEPTLDFKSENRSKLIPSPYVKIFISSILFDFVFEDSYHKQRLGVALGSPLSPVLANVSNLV